MSATHEPDPMAILDSFQQITEMLVGMRAQLMAQGFSSEQAGDLVVLTIRQSQKAQEAGS